MEELLCSPPQESTDAEKLIFSDLLWSFIGVVNVTVTAEAVPSHASCDNEIVSVPERGRIDMVTRSLRVKVGAIK